MSKDRPEGMMSYSMINDVIEKARERTKHIAEQADNDPRFIPCMETVHMLLSVCASYAIWVRDLRVELTKCANRNQEQGELIREAGLIKKRIQ